MCMLENKKPVQALQVCGDSLTSREGSPGSTTQARDAAAVPRGRKNECYCQGSGVPKHPEGTLTTCCGLLPQMRMSVSLMTCVCV